MHKRWMNSIQAFVLLAALSGGIVRAQDTTNIEYGTAGGQSLLLDAHVPDGPGPFPMVLIVHGGGWSRGDARTVIPAFFEPLARTDYTWFSINYRLAPTNHWPACFEDMQTAIRWVKAHAKEYKGDPHRLALMGYSAGGELVCLAAVLAKKDTRVQAVVGISPPTDLVRDIDRRGGLTSSLKALFGHETVDDQTRPLMKEMSPIYFVKPGLPPFLLISGDLDKSVPYDLTVKFQEKLKENNIPCELVTVKGAGHRIEDWDKFDTSYKEKLMAWLSRKLGPAAANPLGASAVEPDITVASDGSGDFKTIQEAVSSIPRENHERTIILIKDGLYHEKVRIDPAFVTLHGQSRQGTRIEFPQGTDDFTNHPDDIGRAVVNINGSDCVIENLTVKNTHGVIGPHAFAISGRGDRTVITDSDVLSQGADTLALWGDHSGSYQARCNFRGSVDFLCPRGWCYMTDCNIYQVNPAAHATIWHDGSRDKDMKFVLRNCKFDGTNNWILARHHHDAQFFLLDCRFSKTMQDKAPYRVVYPIVGDKPSERDAKRNQDLDASNVWGERAYYYDCHRDGGDYTWFADNLSSAPNSPTPEQVTAAWTFAGKWDPERHSGPTIKKVTSQDDRIEVMFSENVTAKGKPRLVLKSGAFADYTSGSGSNTLFFSASTGPSNQVAKVDLQGGAIIASEAAATVRIADLTIP